MKGLARILLVQGLFACAGSLVACAGSGRTIERQPPQPPPQDASSAPSSTASTARLARDRAAAIPGPLPASTGSPPSADNGQAAQRLPRQKEKKVLPPSPTPPSGPPSNTPQPIGPADALDIAGEPASALWQAIGCAQELEKPRTLMAKGKVLPWKGAMGASALPLIALRVNRQRIIGFIEVLESQRLRGDMDNEMFFREMDQTLDCVVRALDDCRGVLVLARTSLDKITPELSAQHKKLVGSAELNRLEKTEQRKILDPIDASRAALGDDCAELDQFIKVLLDAASEARNDYAVCKLELAAPAKTPLPSSALNALIRKIGVTLERLPSDDSW